LLAWILCHGSTSVFAVRAGIVASVVYFIIDLRRKGKGLGKKIQEAPAAQFAAGASFLPGYFGEWFRLISSMPFCRAIESCGPKSRSLLQDGRMAARSDSMAAWSGQCGNCGKRSIANTSRAIDERGHRTDNQSTVSAQGAALPDAEAQPRHVRFMATGS